ncbi:sigma-70 family RNA polymerase sigma factor [Metabacillus bambusae]|uniref:Sigma-70 family RNA polymerase sigma factor n=1 Tax=Metabacillus bambusae TaxID=2795218 RepID=A0ABS3N078_9BACI|nr:sigma-70 family RNA polymerase sigma factor [Metabacillus bambusae]MBO1511524.1 sigma-70 family RNA polymerase sigma factor [Metabacillus bambusae]
MQEITVKMIENENIEEVIAEIMKRYGQEILQLVYSYVNNRAIAEDLTQEIFIKCYKAYPTFNKKSKLRTWLWRIAINHCKDYLRSWYNKNVIIAEEESTKFSSKKESIEQTVIQKDEDNRLVSAVMNLPIKYREVIYLFYYEELLIKEIAVLIEEKESTVKTRLRRAKELLKDSLEE